MKLSKNVLRRSVALLTFGGLAIQSSATYAARCEYVVNAQWESGFTAAIKITNNTSTPVNGWSVNWAYSDGSTKVGGWNANFSGNNPYSASNVGWNGQIQPGQTIEFGVQGNKGVYKGAAPVPAVTGAFCSNSVR